MASARTTLAAPVSPNLATFSPMSLIADASLSRKVACAAPRDSASRPSAPEPAKASSTRTSINGEVPSARQLAWARMLNSASRARLAVGRVAWPSGAAMARPRCLPPTIFSMGSSASVPPVMGSGLGLGFGPAGLARRRLQPEQVVERLRRDLVDRTALELAQMKRPKGDADQAHHRQVKVGQHAPHFAVL